MADELEQTGTEDTQNQVTTDEAPDTAGFDPNEVANWRTAYERLQRIENGEEDVEVYRGIQRAVSKKDQQINELREQLNQLQSAPKNEGNSYLEKLAQNALRELQDADPDRAREIQSSFQYEQMKSQLEEFQRREQEERTNAWLREISQKNREALRAIASDWEVDPDDPRIDYGDDNEAYADRVRRVNQAVKELARKATPVTPKERSVENGTALNAQTGSVRPPTGEVTAEELRDLANKFSREKNPQKKREIEVEYHRKRELFAEQNL